MNYYCILILFGRLLPYISIIGFGTILIFLFLDVIQNHAGKVIVVQEFRLWIVYLAICLITAVLFPNTLGIYRSLMDYIQRGVIAFAVYYVSSSEDSIKWPINLLTTLSVTTAICILYSTGDFSRRLGSIGSASEAISANDIGALMAFGCFTVIFAFNKGIKTSVIRVVLTMAASILFISVISLSGSRKAIIAVIILYILLAVLCTKRFLGNITSTKFILLVLTVGGVLTLAFTLLVPLFENTSLYLRVFGRRAVAASQSNDGRVQLIVQALKDFLNHPFLGLGYNNFLFYHGNYTHSTYVEPLASSGIWGGLYLIPYITIFKKQLYLSRYSKEKILLQKALLAFYISFLFIGMGIPFIYKDVPNVILGMLLGAQGIAYRKLREERSYT